MRGDARRIDPVFFGPASYFRSQNVGHAQAEISDFRKQISNWSRPDPTGFRFQISDPSAEQADVASRLQVSECRIQIPGAKIYRLEGPRRRPDNIGHIPMENLLSPVLGGSGAQAQRPRAQQAAAPRAVARPARARAHVHDEGGAGAAGGQARPCRAQGTQRGARRRSSPGGTVTCYQGPKGGRRKAAMTAEQAVTLCPSLADAG